MGNPLIIPILDAKGGFTYDNVFYKSKEEIYFVWYLTELQNHGIIERWYVPKPITLYESVTIDILTELKPGKVKPKKHHLFHDVTYKGDFAIVWSFKYVQRWFDIIESKPSVYWKKCPFIAMPSTSGLEFDKQGWVQCKSLIDVKGSFKGAHNNSAVTFPIISKILWREHKVYVNKIIPKDLFNDTFHPGRYFFTDKDGSYRKQTKEHPFKIIDSYNP